MEWLALGVDIFNGLLLGFWIYRGIQWRRESREARADQLTASGDYHKLRARFLKLLDAYNYMCGSNYTYGGEYESVEADTTMQFSLPEE